MRGNAAADRAGELPDGNQEAPGSALERSRLG
jgi:hypothetical protein